MSRLSRPVVIRVNSRGAHRERATRHEWSMFVKRIGLGMSNFQLSLLSTFAMTMLASPLLKARLHGHRGRRSSHVPRSATFAQRSANLGRLTGKPGASFQIGTCLLPLVPSPPRYETRSAPSPGRGEASGPLGATPRTHHSPHRLPNPLPPLHIIARRGWPSAASGVPHVELCIWYATAPAK